MMWVGEEVDIPKTFHQATPGPSSLRTNLSPPLRAPLPSTFVEIWEGGIKICEKCEARRMPQIYPPYPSSAAFRVKIFNFYEARQFIT
jgi:hypothetical protein